MVGAASRVDLAMMALDSATLLPSATSSLGSHNSRPKFTSPQLRASRVSATVVPAKPVGGSGA